MIRLLLYQLQLHLRMTSTYVMLLLVALAYGLVLETPPSGFAPIAAMTYDSFIIVWVTLTFVLQLTGFHQFFFQPEALQYRIARLRNRGKIIGASLIHVVILALFATLPFAVIYFSILEDVRIAVMAWSNMALFFVFIGVATAAIVRFTGPGTMAAVVVLGLLFLLPISLNSMGAFAPGLDSNPIVGAVTSLLGSHMDVSGNTTLLMTRGIQDTDAVLRTLILTPILATFTYVHFLRGDHH